jgi:hypothetical protein
MLSERAFETVDRDMPVTVDGNRALLSVCVLHALQTLSCVSAWRFGEPLKEAAIMSLTNVLPIAGARAVEGDSGKIVHSAMSLPSPHLASWSR